VQVEQQVADAGAEVVGEGPDQHQHGELDHREAEVALHLLEVLRRSQAAIEQEQQPERGGEQQRPARAMQDRNHGRDRLSDLQEVEVYGSFFLDGDVGHVESRIQLRIARRS
jgi:hypothetical protein